MGFVTGEVRCDEVAGDAAGFPGLGAICPEDSGDIVGEVWRAQEHRFLSKV